MSERKRTILIWLGIFCAAAAFRLALLGPFRWDDPLEYWAAAKTVLSGHHPGAFHLTIRFPVIYALAILQAVAGDAPAMFYVAAALAFGALVAMTWLLARPLLGNKWALAAGAAVMLFPLFFDEGSRIRIEVHAGAYLLACLLCLLKWSPEAGPRRPAFLVLAGAFYYVSMQCHSLMVLYAPGLLAAIVAWEWRNGKRAAFLAAGGFLAVLAVAYAVEAVYIERFTTFRWLTGRFGVVSHSYGWSGKLERLAGEIDGRLYLRFSHAQGFPFYWQATLVLAAAAVGAAAWRGQARRTAVLWAPLLSFLFLVTFAVKSLDPTPTPLVLFHERYLMSSIPLTLILALAPLAGKWLDGTRWHWPAVGAGAMIATLYVVPVFEQAIALPEPHPLAGLSRMRPIVEDALRTDGLIVTGKDDSHSCAEDVMKGNVKGQTRLVLALYASRPTAARLATGKIRVNGDVHAVVYDRRRFGDVDRIIDLGRRQAPVMRGPLDIRRLRVRMEPCA